MSFCRISGQISHTLPWSDTTVVPKSNLQLGPVYVIAQESIESQSSGPVRGPRLWTLECWELSPLLLGHTTTSPESVPENYSYCKYGKRVAPCLSLGAFE